MGPVIIDSSVLIAALDVEDALHEPAAAALRAQRVQGGRFVVPASVLAEAMVGAAKLGAEAVAILESRVEALVGQVRLIDRPVARAAAFIRAENPAIKLPGALVMATGEVDGATCVLTADERWEKVHDRVKIVGLNASNGKN